MHYGLNFKQLCRRNNAIISNTFVRHISWIFQFFSIWIFFHEHSRITGLQGEGEGISLTSHCHFRLLHRHLDISRATTAESSPLHIAGRQTRNGTWTWGFQVQIANHQATHPQFDLWGNRILGVILGGEYDLYPVETIPRKQSLLFEGLFTRLDLTESLTQQRLMSIAGAFLRYFFLFYKDIWCKYNFLTKNFPIKFQFI